MKKFLYIALFLFLPAATQAQSEASSLLRSLSRTISSIDPYLVGFIAEAEGNEVEGNYRVNGNRYRIEVAGGEIIGDAATRYEINHSNREVIIDRVNPRDRNILTNPAKAFDLAGEAFVSSYQGIKAFGGRSCDVIKLMPNERGQSFSSIVLYIDRAGGLPVAAEYNAEGVEGNVTVIIQSFRKDTSSSPSFFTFDPSRYEGYEIIDFR